MKKLAVMLLLLGHLAFAAKEVQLFSDTNRILIAEPFEVTLLVKGTDWPNDTLEYRWDADSLSKKWEVLEASPIDTSVSHKGWMMQRKYKITTYDTGYIVVPPHKINFGDTVINSSPILIRVDYESVDLEKDIQPVGNILDAPFTFDEIKWTLLYVFIALIALTFTLIGVILLIRKLRKKETQTEYIKPIKEIAKERIDQMEKESKWIHGQSKSFHFEFSETLRLMLDDLYDLHTREATSDDLLKQLSYSSFPQSKFKKLKEILSASDLVKFAKVELDDFKHEKTLEMLKSVYEEYKELEDDKHGME